MVRWIVLACVVVVLTVAGTFVMWYEPEPMVTPPESSHPSVEAPQPKLKLVGSPVYDFGTLPKKTQGDHSWEIQNVGPGELELWLVETSCSCTVAKLADEKGKIGGEKKRVRIPPGGSTPIEVGWDTREWIRFMQTATLGTNDLDYPTFTLSIRGRVLFPVQVDPPEVAFPRISNEETSRSNLTILSPDRPQLKVTKVTSSKPDRIVADVKPMTVEEIQSQHVASGYHVVLEVKPGMPLGEFREVLVFQTDHPKQPELKVTVVGRIVGPISVVPEAVNLPSVSSRSGASQDLTLIVRGGKPTQFRVERAPGKLRVDIVPDDKSGQKGWYRMKVTVPPGAPSGLLQDRIILKTDHPKVGELTIPVTLYISQAKAG